MFGCQGDVMYPQKLHIRTDKGGGWGFFKTTMPFFGLWIMQSPPTEELHLHFPKVRSWGLKNKEPMLPDSTNNPQWVQVLIPWSSMPRWFFTSVVSPVEPNLHLNPLLPLPMVFGPGFRLNALEEETGEGNSPFQCSGRRGIWTVPVGINALEEPM